jgi:ribosomal protein L1
MEAIMGKSLFNTVIAATGLPENAVERELGSLLSRAGKNPETMTLDDLREVLAEYLQSVLLETKENTERLQA